MTLRVVVLASLVLVGACASPPETQRAATMAAPAQFSFEPPRADAPFVHRWLLLGPFDVRGAAAVTPAFFDEAAAAPRAGDGVAGHVWSEHRVSGARVDLRAALGTGEFDAAYAFTYLHAAADRDAVIWLGADNQSRVLLDGAVIHECRARTWFGPDTFGLAVHLTRGVHRLLVRVENCGGGHCFWLRMADASGGPLTEVRLSLAPDDPQLAQYAAASPSEFSPAELLALLPRDAGLRIGFDTAADVSRLAVGPGYEDVCPMWREEGGPEYGPNPGRHGVLGLHPASPTVPERAYWKVRVPDAESVLRVTVSGEAHVARGLADATLRVGVFDGEMRWLRETDVGPYDRPDSRNWCVIAEALPPRTQGHDVLVVLEAASGGRLAWNYEGVWFDEIEIVPAR